MSGRLGDVRMSLTGDLNRESMERMADRLGPDELAAFVHARDLASPRSVLRSFFADHTKDTWTRQELTRLFAGEQDPGDPRAFFAFERTTFGIIHVRTDGERLLVFSHSGEERTNEAYRMRVTDRVAGRRTVVFEPVETR